MNRGQLRTLVLSWLDDPNAGYFTPAQVNVFLNNALKEVQKRLIKAGQNYYVVKKCTTLVYNQRDYALPDDFQKIVRLDIVTAGTAPNETAVVLQPITINQSDYFPTGTGTPVSYFFKGERITVLPAPSNTYEMRLWYNYSVPEMTSDSDVPDCPDRYQELIALLAAQDGFIKDGRANQLIEKKIGEYEEMFNQDAQERNIDFPRSINIMDPGTDSAYYW